MLNIDNINCHKGNLPVLKGLSLTLATGEIGAVMGNNGVGKSTLLHAVAGFISVDSGAICFGGDVLSTEDWVLPVEKRGVGMVFQDYALFPHINVKDNLVFGIRKLNAKERSKRLDEVVELINATNLLSKFPYELSGGEQQRVAIGRTLVTQNRLMLFDEPFSNLDAELKRSLSFGVRSYLKDKNITSLVVSHDRVEALNVCDKIGKLVHGTMHAWEDKRDLPLDSTLLPSA